MIHLSAVGRSYGSGPARVRALEAVTLDFGPGEFTAVAGPSGSGKTTLLNLIGGIDAPTTGTVQFEGRSLAELSERARAALRLTRVGFVFQHFNLIPVLSAAENVELPLLFRRDLGTAERALRVARTLDRVGLHDKRHRKPGELSGGERQRVAVARALAGEPAVVLADEPTASLDHESGGVVIELMHELNRERGITFLYATHDAELIRTAERVIRFRDGRLVEDVR